MEWIYFSPHLDDVAFSCGGLIWEQSRQGIQVSIWTLCAGDPPPGDLSPFASSLHARWQTGPEAVARRRDEDLAACAILKAHCRHFPIPDCIYRRGPSGEALYASEESLFGPLHPSEFRLIARLSRQLQNQLPHRLVLVSPLTLGGHVDHQLTRLLVERLFDRRQAHTEWVLWYYPDYPYAGKAQEEMAQMSQEGWRSHAFPISPQGLSVWERAIAAYASQISTFWPDLQAMAHQLRVYSQLQDGVRLWQQDKIDV